MTQYHLAEITLDDAGLPTPTTEVAQERKVAIFDLLEENHFRPIARNGDAHGPFGLKLGLMDGRLVFDISDHDTKDVNAQVILSLTPFRQVIKDYFQICTAYFDAVKELPPAQIEAIDMGRRGIHNEGARLLRERLEDKIEIDDATARRLFTLISVLHFKG